MPGRMHTPDKIWRLAWTGLLATVATLVMLLLIAPSAPIAHAADPKPPPPPGDCWNGVLSKDRLHCYILEEAQRAGHIEVVAVYLAPGRGPLYIYLQQTEPLSSEVGDYL